jgi:alkylation response protein AidB-like acyl-CoA dehydrogenase
VDFWLTEEQKQLRRSVREFAEGEIGPHVMEWDEVSHFPMEIMPKLAEMGLLGVIFPEELGGAGLGYIEYAIARGWVGGHHRSGAQFVVQQSHF